MRPLYYLLLRHSRRRRLPPAQTIGGSSRSFEGAGKVGLPPRPGGAEPDDDQRPSYRMLLASALIRRGEDTGRVAAATGVPPALVDLLREHAAPLSPTSGGRPRSRKPRIAARPARRSRLYLLLTAQVAAVAAITLSGIALRGGQSGVGLAGALLAALAIALCSRATRAMHRPAYRRKPPTSRS